MRLADDETGGLVYSYPREIEEMRHRRRLEGHEGQAGKGQENGEGSSDRQSDAGASINGSGSATASPRAAASRKPGTDAMWAQDGGHGGPAAHARARRAPLGRPADDGLEGLGHDALEALDASAASRARSIKPDNSCASRMPALVGGVLVLAHTKSSHDRGVGGAAEEGPGAGGASASSGADGGVVSGARRVVAKAPARDAADKVSSVLSLFAGFHDMQT